MAISGKGECAQGETYGMFETRKEFSSELWKPLKAKERINESRGVGTPPWLQQRGGSQGGWMSLEPRRPVRKLILHQGQPQSKPKHFL